MGLGSGFLLEHKMELIQLYLEKMMAFLDKYTDTEKSIEGQIRIVDEDGRRLCHLQEKYLRDKLIVQTSF